MKGKIYRIRNLVDGCVYVGQTTKSLEERYNAHVIDFHARIRHGKKMSRLQEAFFCHGIDSFNIELIEECDVGDLDARERFWIAEFGSCLSERGYNMLSGGRTMAGDANPFFGKTHTPETRAMIRSKNRGRVHSDKSRAKMRDSLVKSDRFKKRFRPVDQHDRNGGLTRSHESINAAARSIVNDDRHISRVGGAIHGCCNGKIKFAYGSVWRYRGDAFDKHPVASVKRHTKIAEFTFDGKFVAVHRSVLAACQASGARHSNVIACCMGRIKTSMDRVWRYVD